MVDSNTATPTPSSDRRRGRLIAAAIGIVVLGGLIGLVVWAFASSDAPTQTKGGDMQGYRTAYDSAMRKAGVKATFPGRIVDLSLVDPVGAHPFEATFTAEEITALLNVYRYDGGAAIDIGVTDALVTLPEDGVLELSGRLTYQGSTYRAAMTAPVTFDGAIQSPGATSLKVSGFGVTGAQRDQATSAVVDYFNAFLSAAPGLTVDEAEVVTGGVRVKGTSPTRIDQPVATSGR